MPGTARAPADVSLTAWPTARVRSRDVGPDAISRATTLLRPVESLTAPLSPLCSWEQREEVKETGSIKRGWAYTMGDREVKAEISGRKRNHEPPLQPPLPQWRRGHRPQQH